MYYILCHNMTTGDISRSERLFFPFQVDKILEELNSLHCNDNFKYTKLKQVNNN